jgi:hypothetical protein
LAQGPPVPILPAPLSCLTGLALLPPGAGRRRGRCGAATSLQLVRWGRRRGGHGVGDRSQRRRGMEAPSGCTITQKGSRGQRRPPSYSKPKALRGGGAEPERELRAGSTCRPPAAAATGTGTRIGRHHQARREGETGTGQALKPGSPGRGRPRHTATLMECGFPQEEPPVPAQRRGGGCPSAPAAGLYHPGGGRRRGARASWGLRPGGPAGLRAGLGREGGCRPRLHPPRPEPASADISPRGGRETPHPALPRPPRAQTPDPPGSRGRASAVQPGLTRPGGASCHLPPLSVLRKQ